MTSGVVVLKTDKQKMLCRGYGCLPEACKEMP